MDYTTLTVDHQRQLVQQQIASLEQQHFAADLAYQAAVAIGDEKVAAEQVGKMKALDKAHDAALAALGNLPQGPPLPTSREEYEARREALVQRRPGR